MKEYKGFCEKCEQPKGMCERCSYIEGTNQFPAHFLPNDGKWEKKVIESKEEQIKEESL